MVVSGEFSRIVASADLKSFRKAATKKSLVFSSCSPLARAGLRGPTKTVLQSEIKECAKTRVKTSILPIIHKISFLPSGIAWTELPQHLDIFVHSVIQK
jgi:hypothetical protein